MTLRSPRVCRASAGVNGQASGFLVGVTPDAAAHLGAQLLCNAERQRRLTRAGGTCMSAPRCCIEHPGAWHILLRSVEACLCRPQWAHQKKKQQQRMMCTFAPAHQMHYTSQQPAPCM